MNSAEIIPEKTITTSTQKIIEDTLVNLGRVIPFIGIAINGAYNLFNLRKVNPFIGVAINGSINTYSIIKVGKNLNCNLDGEMKSPEKRIYLIKTRVFALENICHQIDDIIKQNQ